ncbi:MAG: extracellular solute-binding protein, partial [Spirochaetales bacterium]|nr:extracellular solute-binding protein [Spirochaetales bacterium]
TDMNGSDELVTIDRLGIDVSDILACGISSYSSEKGLLALPFNASALLFYYNKSVYDKAGVGAPSTLDEFAAIAPKTAGEGRTAFTGVPATFELSTFIGAQNGLSYMVDNRNGHDGGATRTLFDTEGTYKAFLEKWKKLFDTGVCSPVSSGVTAEFTSGRTAAMLASSSNLALVLNTVENQFEVGVARVPAVNDKATGGTVISGGALFAFTESDAVKTVLEYLVSPEVQALWSEKTGYVPVSMAAYETESYKAFLEKNPLYKVASDALMDSDPGLANVWVPSAYSIYYSFQANIVDVINGKNIDEAVKEMAAIVNSEIAAFRKQNN